MKNLKNLVFLCVVVLFIFLSCDAGKKINGTFEGSEDTRGYGYNYYTYKFSGKNFTFKIRNDGKEPFEGEAKGTYSITENQIEFLYSNGNIEVKRFSKTENTLTIDNIQFKRIK